jgi:hypothetical protein
MRFEDIVRTYAEQPLTKQLLLDILRHYKRPHDKIDELVKERKLLQIKRGLYIPGPGLDLAPPEPFLVANHLHGPSYVSMDTALSYWKLIPERVFEVSSITTQYTRVYETVIGRFSYRSLPLPYYSFGIRQVALTDKQNVLIASAEKALCDKIVSTPGILLRSMRQVWTVLLEDLRIDKKSLSSLDISAMNSWLGQAPKASSLSMLVKTLIKV